MTYGHGLDDDLHRRLRGAVPPAALAWVERAAGRRVLAQTALEGGTSAAIHRLTLADGVELVLQRFVLDWVVDEPWAPANEAMILRLLADTAVPAPELVAADPDGALTGVPTVLMTALPGELVWNPPDLDRWIDALVETMIMIHSTPIDAQMATWAPYPPEDKPPRRTTQPAAWDRALAAFHGGPPAGERVFVHRDFHPGNVLWRDDRVTGVVDWVDSCTGPPEEDVAHCRVNLARHHGQDVAEEFLSRWLTATGRDGYDPYYDLVDVVSMGGSEPDARLDEFVAAAAARS